MRSCWCRTARAGTHTVPVTGRRGSSPRPLRGGVTFEKRRCRCRERLRDMRRQRGQVSTGGGLPSRGKRRGGGREEGTRRNRHVPPSPRRLVAQSTRRPLPLQVPTAMRTSLAATKRKQSQVCSMRDRGKQQEKKKKRRRRGGVRGRRKR